MVRHKLDSVNDCARKGYNLRITCGGCGYVVDASSQLMLQTIARTRGKPRLLEDLERTLRCSRCGERKASVSPTLAEF